MNYVFSDGVAHLSHAAPAAPSRPFGYLVRDADGLVIPYCAQADTADGLVVRYAAEYCGGRVLFEADERGSPRTAAAWYAAPLAVEEIQVYIRVDGRPELNPAWHAALLAQAEAVRNPPQYRLPEGR